MRFFSALMMLAILAGAARADDSRYALYRLLDVDVPLAEREQIFEHEKAEALAGKTGAQYIVGSLYRIGRALDANVVDADTDQAKRYLSTAAGHGRVLAMAKMAELELAAKRPMDAMVWTQLYIRYKEQSPDMKSAAAVDNYAADLLHRVAAVFDPKQTEQLKAYIAVFVEKYDAAVKAGISESAAELTASGLSTKVHDLHYDSTIARLREQRGDVTAEYVVGFDAHGAPQKIFMLDALPDVLLGKDLRKLAERLRVNESDTPDLRYALVPIQFTYGRYTLKKK